jgi:cytidine deaminase
MQLDQTLVDAATHLLNQRFPAADGIVAAMYTEDGEILTSVFFQPEWGGGGLCAETGAICEAQKRNKRVTASVCVSRLSGDDPIVILTPCGKSFKPVRSASAAPTVILPTAGGPKMTTKCIGHAPPLRSNRFVTMIAIVA